MPSTSRPKPKIRARVNHEVSSASSAFPQFCNLAYTPKLFLKISAILSLENMPDYVKNEELHIGAREFVAVGFQTG
jgi:hypothetical protein